APGKYDFYATVEAVAKVYRYFKRRWKPIQPVGGGYPIILRVKERDYTYFLVDDEILIKVRGPTRLHIFFRAFINDERKVKAHLVLYEGRRLLKSRIQTLKPSNKAFFLTSKDTVKASVPLKVSLRVPKGLHTYRIVVKGARGALKPYVTLKRGYKGTLRFLRPFSDLSKITVSPPVASVSGGPSYMKATDDRKPSRKVKKRRKVRRKFRHHTFGLRSNLRFYSSDNVYHYSDEKISEYESGEFPYRYPGVVSVGDRILSLSVSPYYRYRFSRRSHLRMGFKFGLRRYINNSQLNRNFWGLSLEGRYYGLSGDISYLNIPFIGVRPTYTGIPRTYELLSLSYDRVSFGVGYRFWHLRIGGGYAFGRYDFNSTFDGYDATFSYSRFTLGFMHTLVGALVEVRFAKVEALSPPPTKDWSHRYNRWKAEAYLRFAFLRPYLKYMATTRRYTTTDATDLHYGREDLERHLTLGVEVRFKHLRPYAFHTQRNRTTESPVPVVDVFKDYNERIWGIGIKTLFNLKM
ncbi:MAG: hypothetical protein GXO39_09400, partial [Thermotogae bacterium]|nr:hypothetical protein [Thermotogota bacterium]